MTPRHGYYVVAGRIYTNKLSAFGDAIPKDYFPHWNYHDNLFDKVNWANEPNETLEELYYQRALQLRLKYDYIMISYSGGIDSHTAAESFISRGLNVEQIMNRSARHSFLNNNDKSAKNMGKESLLAAIPQIEKLKKYQPNLVVTHLDWGDDLIKLWSTAKIKETDYSCITQHTLGKAKLHTFFPEIEKFSNPVLICAIDKPHLFLIDGKYHISFMDERIAPHLLNEIEMDHNSPFSVEPFFWSPDAEKILRKQAHLIIQWFETNPQYKDILTFPHRSTAWGKRTYEEIIKRIIYPSYDPTLWQADKGTNFFWLEEEHWWQNNPNSISVKNWRNVVDEYSKITYDIFSKANKLEYLKKDGPNWQLPACYSKLHLIK